MVKMDEGKIDDRGRPLPGQKWPEGKSLAVKLRAPVKN
jgi:hypothetical protein